MPVATIDGLTVRYRLEGAGDETIVLINGLADDLETWAFQVDDFLAAGYRVLRFDNRGVGGTGKPAGPYSSRMLADDAKHLRRNTPWPTGRTCARSPSGAPTPRRARSAPGCSPCGPTWRPWSGCRSSCAT
jgi:pimeloyl-ACP methyl ester carboxylesterase